MRIIQETIQETRDIEDWQISQPLEVLVLEIRALKVGVVETGVFLWAFWVSKYPHVPQREMWEVMSATSFQQLNTWRRS